MKFLCAIVLLFLLSGCSDDAGRPQDMSDLTLYVEEVKSRRLERHTIGDGYPVPWQLLPEFEPTDNPFRRTLAEAKVTNPNCGRCY